MTNLQKLINDYKDAESSLPEEGLSEDYTYYECYDAGFQHGYARACHEIAVMLPVEYNER